MSKINFSRIITGDFQTNCYILDNENECVIIDPGQGLKEIEKFILEKQIKPNKIILTHGHFDHIFNASDLAKIYNILIYAGIEEKVLLMNPEYNMSNYAGYSMKLEADKYWTEEDKIEIFEDYYFEPVHTPGHTPGSYCLYLKYNKQDILFSGDTLFYRSIGRTDLPLSSAGDMEKSLYKLFAMYKGSTEVYPGHGQKTILKEERANNPFIKIIRDYENA